MHNLVGTLNFLFIRWYCEVSIIIQVTLGQSGVIIKSKSIWTPASCRLLSNVYLITRERTLGKMREEGKAARRPFSPKYLKLVLDVDVLCISCGF